MNGSAELGDIISKLTENPDMMKTLMGVAENIMGDKNQNSAPTAPVSSIISDKNDIREDCECKDKECGEEGEKYERHFGRRGNDAENLIRLLLALRPFVSRDRCDKIDSIVKILKLIQLSEKTGLLKSLL